MQQEKNLSSVLFQEAKFHKIHKRENINILRAEDVRKTSMIVLRFLSKKKTGEQDMICMLHSHATCLYLSEGLKLFSDAFPTLP